MFTVHLLYNNVHNIVPLGIENELHAKSQEKSIYALYNIKIFFVNNKFAKHLESKANFVCKD